MTRQIRVRSTASSASSASSFRRYIKPISALSPDDLTPERNSRPWNSSQKSLCRLFQNRGSPHAHPPSFEAPARKSFCPIAAGLTPVQCPDSNIFRNMYPLLSACLAISRTNFHICAHGPSDRDMLGRAFRRSPGIVRCTDPCA